MDEPRPDFPTVIETMPDQRMDDVVITEDPDSEDPKIFVGQFVTKVSTNVANNLETTIPCHGQVISFEDSFGYTSFEIIYEDGEMETMGVNDLRNLIVPQSSIPLSNVDRILMRVSVD